MGRGIRAEDGVCNGQHGRVGGDGVAGAVRNDAAVEVAVSCKAVGLLDLQHRARRVINVADGPRRLRRPACVHRYRTHALFAGDCQSSRCVQHLAAHWADWAFVCGAGAVYSGGPGGRIRRELC